MLAVAVWSVMILICTVLFLLLWYVILISSYFMICAERSGVVLGRLRGHS
jgi:hypothetical protein